MVKHLDADGAAILPLHLRDARRAQARAGGAHLVAVVDLKAEVNSAEVGGRG